MLSAKALIIGVASTATVGGVSYLTFTAIKEEEREGLEFSGKWDKAVNDEAKMRLLEEELKTLCAGKDDGCQNKDQINGLIKKKKPGLEAFFDGKKFSPSESATSGFTETCKKIKAEMTIIKAYCPD